MKLVVGLGNPGNDYRDTYHNIGFNALDKLSSWYQAPDFTLDKKSNSLLSDVNLFGDRVLLCKPQTFMNLSGNAVAQLVHYYKLEPRSVLVVYDDIDIEKGCVRARLSGSAGTHNGMRDIVYKLGSEEFARVRIGTGFRPPYMGLADYVLSRFSGDTKLLLDKACGAACDFIETWLGGKAWETLTVTVKP